MRTKRKERKEGERGTYRWALQARGPRSSSILKLADRHERASSKSELNSAPDPRKIQGWQEGCQNLPHLAMGVVPRRGPRPAGRRGARAHCGTTISSARGRSKGSRMSSCWLSLIRSGSRSKRMCLKGISIPFDVTPTASSSNFWMKPSSLENFDATLKKLSSRRNFGLPAGAFDADSVRSLFAFVTSLSSGGLLALEGSRFPQLLVHHGFNLRFHCSRVEWVLERHQFVH